MKYNNKSSKKCPECGELYSGKTCPTCKEASDMPEGTEFVLLKLEDLETIEAGDGVSQVIVKDGARAPVFELEGVEDAQEVAKAITAAFEKHTEDEPVDEDLEKQDDSEDDAEWSPKELTKTIGGLSEAVTAIGARVEEIGSQPMKRPELPSLTPTPTEPHLQKIAEDDTAEQLIEKDQATLNKVVGKEDATLPEAMAKVGEWVETGEAETDKNKSRLRDEVSNIAFRQK